MKMELQVGLTILLCLINGMCCIPLAEFFPYTGDQVTERITTLQDGDDATSATIGTEEAYILYGIPVGSLIVSLIRPLFGYY